jgi:hypothetical protein
VIVQQGPQAYTVAEHCVAGDAAAPHVTVHCELSVHVARQSASHLMVHADEFAQVTLLASPSCSLHVALSLHVTADAGPNFRSQVELAVHVARLPAPPTPLHSDESLQVRVSCSYELALHLAELEHTSWQSASPQVVLQSAPATHVQAASVHVQPVPVHAGSGTRLPHARPSTIITIASM